MNLCLTKLSLLHVLILYKKCVF